MTLKKQIAVAGHVLVRKYVDDGYPGARLDRPALDRMRRDIKTNLTLPASLRSVETRPGQPLPRCPASRYNSR
jgi:hypothetical protein